MWCKLGAVNERSSLTQACLNIFNFYNLYIQSKRIKFGGYVSSEMQKKKTNLINYMYNFYVLSLELMFLEVKNIFLSTQYSHIKLYLECWASRFNNSMQIFETDYKCVMKPLSMSYLDHKIITWYKVIIIISNNTFRDYVRMTNVRGPFYIHVVIKVERVNQEWIIRLLNICARFSLVRSPIDLTTV